MRLSQNKLFGILKRSLTPDRPYHAQWFLTRRCNYRCRTCNVWRDLHPPPELPTEAVKRGLDVFRKLGVIDLVLSGGNPLLREDIDQIIEYSSRFFITTIYDNGSMATQKVDALQKADFVAISLDSLDEHKNDYLRGVRGATRRALNSIRILKKEGISVGVAPTISRANIHEIVDFTKYFVSRGIPVWYAMYSYDNPIDNRLFGIGRKSDEFELSDGTEVASLCTDLMRIKKNYSGVFIPDKVLYTLQKLFGDKKRTWRCKALTSFFMADCQGRIASCHYYPPVADITDVLDKWGTPAYMKLREFYGNCTECTYLCYMFYSLYSNAFYNLELIRDQAKNGILSLSLK
jgi:MoaA/NifB/PqqE/SkfB family radical SAM enzyme